MTGPQGWLGDRGGRTVPSRSGGTLFTWEATSRVLLRGSTMKKFAAVISLLASTLVVPLLNAAPASARCAPPGNEVIYVFKNKSFTYYPTNIHSDWAIFRKGGSITYSKTKTMQVSASVTATVSAE